MSGARVKTMVIMVLALINVIFLTVIIADTVVDARSERTAVADACAILQNSGIMIDPENVRTVGDLRTVKTARGGEAEEAIARAVLGDTVMSDQGVIYVYENAENGAAEFYSAGDFEIVLNNGVVTGAGGTLRAVSMLLRSMNLETSGVVATGAPGSETVVATGAYKGTSVFNCTIEFVFADGDLRLIKGRFFSGAEPDENGTVISHVGTAMLGFLAAIRNAEREDVMCSQIYSVEAGYQYRVVGSFGEGVIEPAWLFTTDGGRYLIDDTTGEIRLMS